MTNIVILEGYVARVYGSSESGKLGKCSLVWSRWDKEKQEKTEEVFLSCWYWNKGQRIAKGDRVIFRGELRQRKVEDGGHRTYLFGSLDVLETKEEREARKREKAQGLDEEIPNL